MIGVLIPTMGRKTLNITLTGVMASKLVSSIYILDSGEIPCIDEDTSILFDLIKRLGVNLVYIRKDASIGEARYDLIKICQEEIALFLDDDVYIAPDELDKLYHELKYRETTHYVVPTNIIVTDYLGVKNLDRKCHSEQEVHAIVGKKTWMYPYFRYYTTAPILIEFCGTQCVLFKTEKIKKNKLLSNLKRWKVGYPREDTYFTSLMKHGLLIPTVTSWHLQTTKKRHDWHSKDEELGYESVSKGEIEYYTES
jgi:glycosyltransferase involved in cell wall biosynthesis